MCFTVALVRNNKLITAERYYNEAPLKGIIKEKDDIVFRADNQLFGDTQAQHSTEFPEYYFVSGFSHPELPILKADGIYLYQWGLIPSWIKDTQSANEISNKTLNAVGETVFEKPSFRKCIPSQRCVLGVSGFYEWRDVNGVKYPYFVHATENDIFSLGAIFDTWVDRASRETRNTFSILTTHSNPLMDKIHNLKKRMPLILSTSDEMKWIDPSLKPEQIIELIKPYPENDMTAYTISRAANNARNNRNVPEILNRVEYPELDLVC